MLQDSPWNRSSDQGTEGIGRAAERERSQSPKLARQVGRFFEDQPNRWRNCCTTESIRQTSRSYDPSSQAHRIDDKRLRVGYRLSFKPRLHFSFSRADPRPLCFFLLHSDDSFVASWVGRESLFPFERSLRVSIVDLSLFLSSHSHATFLPRRELRS